MQIQLYAAPTIEPISLANLKLHIRADSGSFADNVDETQSIAPGLKTFIDNWTTHAGSAVEVLGYKALVVFSSGTNGAGGTVDVKIQECDTLAGTYTDWTGGAFTQVTTVNDNATYEIEYTGSKKYIKVVSKVLVADCSFGVLIIRLTATPIEDDLLNAIITASREHVEDITRRALLTQTWDYYLDAFPAENFIKIPFGSLQSVTHIKYTDSDGAQTTMTVTTEYLVETNGEGIGRIILPYGVSWPSFTPYTSKPIVIRFVCGWTTAALVPYKIKAACLMIAADLYSNRESQSVGQAQIYFENKTVQRLLSSSRLWDEFE